MPKDPPAVSHPQQKNQFKFHTFALQFHTVSLPHKHTHTHIHTYTHTPLSTSQICVSSTPLLNFPFPPASDFEMLSVFPPLPFFLLCMGTLSADSLPISCSSPLTCQFLFLTSRVPIPLFSSSVTPKLALLISTNS